METTSEVNTRSCLREQVAQSKGIEWMISSYKAWQQRAPLGGKPKRNNSSRLRLVNRMEPVEL